MTTRKLTSTLFASFVLLAPALASAQTHELYFHQTGALLNYADAEVRILYAALTAKEFDPDLTKRTLEELDRTLSAAKKNVDRVTALLPEKLTKVQPDLVKFREQIKNTEDQLQKLATDIEEQTAPREAEGDLADELEEAAAAPARDWNLLKNGCGWLYTDIKTSKGVYAKLARQLKVKPVRTPKRPRGKRE